MPWFWQKANFKPNAGDTFEVSCIGNATNNLGGFPPETYAQLQEAVQYKGMIGIVHLRIPEQGDKYECLGAGFIFQYEGSIAFALEHGIGNRLGGYFYPRDDGGIVATVFTVNYTTG